MKRIFAVGFSVVYIGILTFGNACHLLQFATASHPLMYMIVWDMFCGWSALDSRIHIIAEGESEKYYDLTHAPWGEIHAFGYIGRENYDAFNSHTPMLGLNVLRHTQHEPIARLFVVEECWPKKYNLPDPVWNMRYDNPKDDHRYYRLRVVLLPDGTVTQRYNCFNAFQSGLMAVDNPRLQQQAMMHKPMFILDRPSPGRDGLINMPSNGLPAQPISAPAAH